METGEFICARPCSPLLPPSPSWLTSSPDGSPRAAKRALSLQHRPRPSTHTTAVLEAADVSCLRARQRDEMMSWRLPHADRVYRHLDHRWWPSRTGNEPYA